MHSQRPQHQLIHFSLISMVIAPAGVADVRAQIYHLATGTFDIDERPCEPTCLYTFIAHRIWGLMPEGDEMAIRPTRPDILRIAPSAEPKNPNFESRGSSESAKVVRSSALAASRCHGARGTQGHPMAPGRPWKARESTTVGASRPGLSC